MQAAADERTEALEKKIDAGFAEMRAEFKAVRAEMRAESKVARAEMRDLRTEVKDEIRISRTEMREDLNSVRASEAAHFRAIYPIVCMMLLTSIFGFAGILLNHV